MRRTRTGLPWTFAASLVVFAGCGETVTRPATPLASHGGMMVPLPDGKGFVELLTDGPAAKRGARDAKMKSRLVAYFYQPDGSTALSPAPSDVKVKVGAADASPVVKLAPQTAEAGKFASELDVFPNGFRGQLDAQVDGQTMQATFSIR